MKNKEFRVLKRRINQPAHRKWKKFWNIGRITSKIITFLRKIKMAAIAMATTI
jgi:hypothetical protein